MTRTKLGKLAYKGRKAVSLAARVARMRSRSDAVSKSLARAPLDDEELTPEDLVAVEEARAESRPGLSLAEVRRRLEERRRELGDG